MKHLYTPLIVLTLVVCLSACGDSQAERNYEQNRSELETIKAQYDALSAQSEEWMRLSQEEKSEKIAAAQAKRIQVQTALRPKYDPEIIKAEGTAKQSEVPTETGLPAPNMSGKGTTDSTQTPQMRLNKIRQSSR